MPSPWLQIWLEAGREGQVFTYLDLGEKTPAGIGDLVRVRLQGRRHVGLVIEVLGQCPNELLNKTIYSIEAIVQQAAIEPHWQKMMAAVASSCHTSPFKTLKAALPPGWLGQGRAGPESTPRPRWQVSLARDPGAEDPKINSKITPKQWALLDHLALAEGPIPLADLGKGGWSPSVLQALERRGLVTREPLAKPPGGAAAGECSSSGHPARAANAAQANAAQANAAQANAAQAMAIGEISASIGGAGQEFLLWGITGAGKTEVYLQAAALALSKAKSVLLLTPEIGLIPQLLDRTRERFGAQVVEFHSGMADGARIAAWRRCLNESPLVVVGTRSAIFLPLISLGLIVLDEEHDSSYKQESPMPCYHARDVAQLRCRQESATLVLGSATPSLESWLGSQGPNPRTKLLRLPERIGKRPLPAVRIIDMRQELVEGHRRLLSRALMGRLESLQSRGEQAVVLVPRRGYRAFLSCRSCGEAVMCPNCDRALTVHRRGNGQEWLRCHWCDHRAEVDSRCLHCGSTAFKPFGAGTQRVMEQLNSELEGLRVLRFDRDTTRGRNGHRRLLDRFAAGEADVLVGTQMLAKGMDLPRVTLAAVLAADGLLHRPDLRSSEQCLQLLLQLAGRAGRGEQPGEVLVQTYSPTHPVISHLVDGRYEAFLAEEIDLRRQAGLVPFSRACLLRISGPTASGTATAATSLAERIRPMVETAGWLLIGPAPAPMAKVAGKSRWQLLLHGPGGSALPLPSEADLRQGLPAGVGLAIDPDPITL